MKTSLQDLPEDNRQELESITETIVSLIQPEMVILFGSYSRGDQVNDTYKENGTTYTYKSDYDILVVTTKPQDMPPGLAKQIRQKVKKAENMQTTPHIIFHDIKYLNKELEDGHYFFADIMKEGTMMYNSGNVELAVPKVLSGKERAEKAQLYFDNWFKDGNGFMRQYNHAVNDNDLKIAIFLLHQAAERYYNTIALVFTDYKPKTHDLVQLNKEACSADARFKVVFPNQTDEEKRLFNLLVKAYIDSRYKLGYTVDAGDLEWLAGRVQKLKELTEAVCRERVRIYSVN